MGKRVVLFVDDEPNVLAGLQSRLHRQRDKWDMLFVQSGNEALEALEKTNIDVIVSDMRMPEMDGATLLKHVQDQYPQVVRIVLSGHAEMETALRVIPVAHQFLSKPCEAGVIENVVERACALQSLINEEVVKRIVGRIDRLPSLPRIYYQLIQTLTSEKTTAEDVAKILKQDMAMCAKILQIVNSAFFRLARTITKVEEAVVYLGFNTIKQIVLAAEVFSYSRDYSTTTISLHSLQVHAFRVGALASSLFTDKQNKEDAFIAGLLHDIGKLALATDLPEHFEKALREMQEKECALHAAEKAVWGATHAEVGAYMLGLWGLPYSIVEAVANHHEPQRVASRDFNILATTHIADGLINEVTAELGHVSDHIGSSVNLEYLDEMGLSGKLEEWRQQARSFVTQAAMIN